jgi:L-lactate dehydrogenase (cytochrome)
VNSDRSKSAEVLRAAKALGVRAVFVTVDAPVTGKREADERMAADNIASPISGAVSSNDKKGGGLGRLMASYIDSTLTWEDIPWIKETAGVPVVLKGVQTAADARKAVQYGADGILLSNHGGRSLDT